VSSRGWFEDGGAGDGDDADIVLLAEGLGGVCDLRCASGGLEQFVNAIEAEEVAVGVGSFSDTVGEDHEAISRLQCEMQK